MSENYVNLSRTQFIYPPLDRSLPHVRLVRFLPTLNDGLIRLTLRTNYNLKDGTFDGATAKSPYRALSYTWDNVHARRTIIINECGLQIGANLYAFLQNLLDHHGGVNLGWLWADAICIDQDSVAERNHQVQLMKTVYTSAEEVLGWIGESEHRLDSKLFEALSLVADDIRILSHSKYDPLNVVRDLYRPWGPQKLLQNPGIVDCLVRLCRRRYWSRLWVLQELVLASRATIICGEYSIDLVAFLVLRGWCTLTDSLDKSLRHLSATTTEYMRQVEHLDSIYDLLYYPAKCRTSLLKLVQFCKSWNCEILFDRIYGVLGLLRDQQFSVTVDYNMPACQLFLECVSRVSGNKSWYDCYVLAKVLGVRFEITDTDIIVRTSDEYHPSISEVRIISLPLHHDYISSDCISGKDDLANIVPTFSQRILRQSDQLAETDVVLTYETWLKVLNADRDLEKTATGQLWHFDPDQALQAADNLPSTTGYTLCVFSEGTYTSDLDMLPEILVLFLHNEYVATIFRNGTNYYPVFDYGHSTWLIERDHIRHEVTQINLPLYSILFILAHLLPTIKELQIGQDAT